MYWFAFVLVVTTASSASAQTTLNGNLFAFRSNGSASGSNWNLVDNGYVGTYITLATPGDVTISVNASGTPALGIAPRMSIAVDDSKASFDVASGFNTYQQTFALPAGTHFVRTDFSNDPEQSSRELTIGGLNVTGATLENSTSSVTALAAADTYIENGRKGDAHLQLLGAAPGSQVHVELRNHAFNFGTAGASPSGGVDFWQVNPAVGSTAYKYQQFIKSHFNMLVPENAGKWSSNESTRDLVNMDGNDAIVNFARQNGMRFREHNLIWGNNAGSPSWVNTLVSQAVAGNAAAKADLLAEINERIAYYVGDGVGPDRANDYFALDVLNEGMHENEFRTIFGDAGLASIYSSVAAAAQAAGANVDLYINEFNVLQWSSNPTTSQSDGYANWYREHGEALEMAGGQVDGYGVQYYALLDSHANTLSPHSAARMQAVFQNLSLTGKPLQLTEFGIQNAGTPSTAAAANALSDTMRMVFGSPNADAFNMWGFWQGAIWNQATLGALVDLNWNLTPVGQRYEQLMNQWHTNLTLTADQSGAIDFRGFYGDYDVTIDGKTYRISLTKGQPQYELAVRLGADFNHDNAVDNADLALWQANVGANAIADADGDGDTDGADFIIWQLQNGRSTSPYTAAAQVVPEPATGLLIAWILAPAFAFLSRDNSPRSRLVGTRR
jgi:endo-1,4-beta-xylanase